MTPKKSLSFLLAISLLFSSCAAREILYSGQKLFGGGSGALQRGTYALVLLSDCNLVLYASIPVAASIVWSSRTAGKGVNCFAQLTANGVLGVYNGAGKSLWTSGPPLAPGSYILVLQPNRDLVIYGPARWASGTKIATPGFSQFAINATVNNP